MGASSGSFSEVLLVPILLVFLAILVSANFLIQVGLKKSPIDPKKRVEARLAPCGGELPEGRRFGLRVNDGSKDGDIMGLKNYMNAQYFGEIGIVKHNCLFLPFKVSGRNIKHIQEERLEFKRVVEFSPDNGCLCDQSSNL